MKKAKREINDIIRMIINNDKEVVCREKHIKWVSLEIALFGVLERFQKRVVEAVQAKEKA